jgi:uncharacterized membrane protein YkvA (DUF1232 family)
MGLQPPGFCYCIRLPCENILPDCRKFRLPVSDLRRYNRKVSGMFGKLKSAGRNLRNELRVYQLVLKDKRTPKISNILLGLAVGYILLPFDLIPDFIPVIGHLDDVIIVPLLVIAALKFNRKRSLMIAARERFKYNYIVLSRRENTNQDSIACCREY